jgi:hypothetical protein
MTADWDNLLIFDACRSDLFEENHTLPGKLKRVSLGAGDSPEFMEKQFSGSYPDTVYVTGNPFAVELDAGTFHAVINLFESGWNEELETVLPDAVTDAGLEAAGEYPEKRLILHYMQPHFPFIGEQGRSLDTGNISGDTVDETLSDDRPGIWTQLQKRKTRSLFCSGLLVSS